MGRGNAMERNKKDNNTLNIIDTHAHLDMSPFDADRDEVIGRAANLGVNTIITIGIDLESSRKAIALAEKYPGVLASIGIHPQESMGIKKEDIDELAKMAGHPRVVGLGEMGLDFYRNQSPREAQLQVLEWELEMAKKAGLPVIIHSRQAQGETTEILRNWADSYRLPEEKPRGVIHCFSGDLESAENYMEMGFLISLGGYIGYPSSAQLRETLKNIPLDSLVIETDCPFLPPQKFRGQRNEPSYTLITLGVMAEIKQVSLEAIAAQTTENASRLFNLSSKLIKSDISQG
jgi:TatD DNase family protein